MTLSEILKIVIEETDRNDELAVVYAKRINGQFSRQSEAKVLYLDEEETDLPVEEVARTKCPGLDYFLEVEIIHEVLEGLLANNPKIEGGGIIDGIIYYGEHDAYPE